jgi:hypothetical protein
MSTTVTTYLARDLIDLGSLSGDLIGLALFPPSPGPDRGVARGLGRDRLSPGPSGGPAVGPQLRPAGPAGGDGGHPARAVLGR